MRMSVYLSGEIHSDWREKILQETRDNELPLDLLGPVTDHGASDGVGSKTLGDEDSPFWKDHKSAKINRIRTGTLIDKSDIVVVKFGDKFRQWNAAFEAGYAAAKGKPLITIHPPDLTHPLKEVDAAALAVAETPEQVVEIFKYITADL